MNVALDHHPAPVRKLTFAQARLLILGLGVVALGVTAIVMWARDVDSVEIWSTLLFLPVLGAFLYWSIPGGAIAGLLAGGAYVLLRHSGIDAVGWSEFSGLIVGRVVGYLSFGVLGGLGTSWLEESLSKLEHTDYIDDDTGLYNARFLIDETNVRGQESNRYGTFFALIGLDLPRETFAAQSRRARHDAIRAVGDFLHQRVRTVDRAVAIAADDRIRFLFVLPSTPKEGAEIAAHRMGEALEELLAGLGAEAAASAQLLPVIGYPEDVAGVNELRSEAARLGGLPEPEPLAVQKVGPAAQQ